MTVKELIEQLKQCPPDEKVYREGGEYKDDLREIRKAKQFGPRWGLAGVLVE